MECYHLFLNLFWQVAETVIRDYIFVHLNDNNDKFNLLMLVITSFFIKTVLPLLCLYFFTYFGWRKLTAFLTLDLRLISFFSFMLQKLFSIVDHTSVSDNPDSLQNQEILLPGHLITIYLKVETW